MKRFAGGGAFVVAAVLVLGGPAGAQAGDATRYAEPGGNGADPCLKADPCSIQTAVNGSQPFDSVALLPGTYNLGVGTLDLITPGLTVAGTKTAEDTIITSTGINGVTISDVDQTLSDVTIRGSYERAALLIRDGGVDRVYAENTGNGPAFACFLGQNANLNDSVCYGSGADVIGAQASGAADDDVNAYVRSSTIVSDGSIGAYVEAVGSAEVGMRIQNSVVSSAGDELVASADSGTVASIIVETSAFQTSSTRGGGTITTGAGNISASDLKFADAANGNFRLTEDSPAVDAGTVENAFPSVLDLDRNKRTVGPAPDMGAYEFGDQESPKVTFTKTPDKRSGKSSAKFSWDVTDNEPIGEISFRCKLDNGKLKRCDSPQKVKNLDKGRHKFTVEATDAGGNNDSVSYSWRVTG